MEVQEAIPQLGQATSASAAFPPLAQQILATGRKVLTQERLLTLGWFLDLVSLRPWGGSLRTLRPLRL